MDKKQKQKNQQINTSLQEADKPQLETQKSELPVEIGGVTGLEPTRYGDWERNGRCTDF